MQTTKNLLNLSLLREFDSTFKKLSIYPSDHPAVKTALQKTNQLFQEVLKNKEEINLGRVENKLVLEGESLEGNAISDKVWDTLERQKIKSICFCQGLNQEELKSFLKFFLKKEEEDLNSYLQKNKITHIKVNRVRYEIVSEDEKVVKTDLMDQVSLKSELPKVIRTHPELLKDILLGKSIEEKRLHSAFKNLLVSSFSEVEQGSSAGKGLGAGEVGIDVKQMMEQIKDEINNLTDDEILALLTYNLKQSPPG